MSNTVPKVVIPVALVLLLGVLAFVAVRRPAIFPLAASGRSPRLVLLLVPGLSVADLTDDAHAPALTAAAESGIVGATPALRPRIRRGRHLPDDVCQKQEWPLTAPSGSLVFSLPLDDNTAADGKRTDSEALAAGILRATRNDSSASITAVFDDLCRNDRYAPLALADVTRSERGYALKRLNETVARLTSPDGLPADALLVVVSTAPASSEHLCPVVFWQRNGGKTDSDRGDDRAGGGLLVSPTTRYAPGLVTRNDVTATVAALLGKPAPNRTGALIAVLRTRNGPAHLMDLADAWSYRARAAVFMDGMVWLLFPLTLLLAGALWASRSPGRVLALRLINLTLSLILLIDCWLGGPLLSRTPLAWGFFSGDRLYGLGAAASGLLVGSALLGSPALGSRMSSALWRVLAVGTLLAPTVGADTGGALAALVGFAVTAAVQAATDDAEDESAPPERGKRRAVSILIATVVFITGIAAFSLWRNGLAGFLAARAPGLLFAHPLWGILLIAAGALAYHLWSRPDAGMHREEYAGLIGVFAATLAFLLLDNTPLLGATSCLLCAVPPLLVANARYWTEPAGGETDRDGESNRT